MQENQGYQTYPGSVILWLPQDRSHCACPIYSTLLSDITQNVANLNLQDHGFCKAVAN